MHIPSQTVTDSSMHVSLSMSVYGSKTGCEQISVDFNDSQETLIHSLLLSQIISVTEHDSVT